MKSSEDEAFLSEGSSAGILGSGIEPLHGAGIFYNREEKKSSHWSVPWSDLMMTMFVLFAVLYIYNTSTKEVRASSEKSSIIFHEETKPPPVPVEDLSQFYEKSRQTLKVDKLKDITSVELTKDKAVKIILPGDVFFDTGVAELKADAIGSLKAVGDLIRDTNYAVTVAGHTDNIPIHTDRFPSNWELSTARACVAAKFLINETNISPERIQVTGYAEHRPIESNDTPEGRNANRRVEIIISKDHISDDLNAL